MDVLPIFFFEVVITLTQKILAMGKTISCLPSPGKITISIGGINKQFPVMGGKNGIVLPAIYIYIHTLFAYPISSMNRFTFRTSRRVVVKRPGGDFVSQKRS